MEQNNGRQNKQDIDIAQLSTNVGWMKKEIATIKDQVFNHLPTEIGKCVKRTDFIVGVAIVVAIQIILKFFL